MKNICLISGAALILFSVGLGRLFLNILYSGINLAGEYDVLMEGSIASIRWLGALVFCFGIVLTVLEKKQVPVK